MNVPDFRVLRAGDYSKINATVMRCLPLKCGICGTCGICYVIYVNTKDPCKAGFRAFLYAIDIATDPHILCKYPVSLVRLRERSPGIILS